MARDVITMIEQDHRELQHIFAQLRADSGDRELLFQQLTVMLAAHSRAEEAEVYPEIARVNDELKVRHAREEHAEADQLVAQLKMLHPQSRDFRRLLHQLMDSVDHHIAEEESSYLPELRRLKVGKRAELAEAFAARRGAELAHGPSLRQVGGSELSRERLYERAREHNVAGRSHMSREQLQEAIREAEGE